MFYFITLLIAFPILIIVYAGWSGQRVPDINPNNFDSKNFKKKKIVVCCGDSITHGRIGYNWVEYLNKKNPGYIFINAGINGDLTWNVYKRLNDIIKCKPSIITLLIGTNDAMGSQTKKLGNDYIKMKKLPKPPSNDWFKENYEKILLKLINNTDAKIYPITLPWVGEDENSIISKIIGDQNDIIQNLARKYELDVIQFNEKIKTELIEIAKDEDQSQFRYEIDYKRMYRIARAVILYYGFNYSWNAISKKYGLYYSCDFIHLNDDGGSMLAKMVQKKIDI